MVAKHPSLSAVPVGELSAPRFVLLPYIDAEKVVTFARSEIDRDRDQESYSQSILDEVVRAQHNAPFQHESPLQPFWRLTVLEHTGDTSSFTLCFCFHHALADTRSSLVFLQDLEHALSHPASTSTSTILVPSGAPLLPPMESLHDFPLTQDFLSQQQAPCEPSPEIWSGQPQILPVKTNFASLWLSIIPTRRLVQISREQGSSLTGALMSVLAESCFQVLPPSYTKINGDCAISLRDFLPAPITATSMGCYVGSFSQSYNRDSSSIWEDARRTKAKIRDIVANGAPDIPSTYLKHIPDMEAWFNGKFGKRRAAAWEISNVGPLAKLEGDDQAYRMESLLFSQSSSACSGAIKISVATGRDGRLSLGFTWQEGIVEDEVARDFMRRVNELIQQITGST